MKKFMIKAVAIIITCTSFTLYAHDKVVVIPLGGDEPQAAKSKKIFWTDSLHTGNLGGLAGADAICQAEADNQTPPVQGTFKAWLGVSTGGDAIPARQGFVYHDLPYVNVDGSAVASHFIDFLDNDFDGFINSVSNIEYDALYWTGLTNDGISSGESCFFWTESTNDFPTRVGNAWGGNAPLTSWSDHTDWFCGGEAHVLCFEQ